jgi:hypothetical protein
MNIVLFASIKNLEPIVGISMLGEISTHCRTFFKVPQDYYNKESHFILTSLRDAVDELRLNIIWELLEHTRVSASVISSIPALETRLSTGRPIAGLTIRDVLDDGVNKLPSKMKFTIPGSQPVHVTIYFSDALLRTDYRNTTYVVIPPTALGQIDSLSVNETQLPELETLPTTEYLNQRVGSIPYTSLHDVKVPIHALDNDNAVRIVTFYVAVYGPYSGNSTQLNAAIINFITNETLLDIDTWKMRTAPSLWVNNSYRILPNWGARSVPSRPLSDYSSTINISELLDYVYPLSDYVTMGLVINKLQSFTSTYRGLVLSILPMDDEPDFSSIYPDYTHDILEGDGDSASAKTMEFAKMLSNMIVIAEGTVSGDLIADGLSIVNLSDKEYVVGSVDNTVFYMLTRGSSRWSV